MGALLSRASLIGQNQQATEEDASSSVNQAGGGKSVVEAPLWVYAVSFAVAGCRGSRGNATP